jgi:hypothetical protein
MASKTEHILCAAIHVDDGREYPHQPTKTGLVFGGHRHHNCIAVIASVMPGHMRNWHQGFLTSLGRFVNRREAKKMATTAGQIVRISGSAADPDLYSEDLY